MTICEGRNATLPGEVTSVSFSAIIASCCLVLLAHTVGVHNTRCALIAVTKAIQVSRNKRARARVRCVGSACHQNVFFSPAPLHTRLSSRSWKTSQQQAPGKIPRTFGNACRGIHWLNLWKRMPPRHAHEGHTTSRAHAAQRSLGHFGQEAPRHNAPHRIT